MLEQAIHDIARVGGLFMAMAANGGLAGRQILGAIAAGAVVGGVCLIVLLAANSWNAIALWVAARRVEALAMNPHLLRGKAGVRPFRYAFRHSDRLARWAELSLESGGPEESDERAAALEILPSTDSETPSAVHRYFLAASERYFSIAIVVGGLSQVLALVILLLGSSLAVAQIVAPLNLSETFNVTMLIAMGAAGFGISGLVSPFVLWPASRANRRNERRLRRAVRDVRTAVDDTAPPQANAVNLTAGIELSLLRQALEDERRVRIIDAERLTQAVAQIQDSLQLFLQGKDSGNAGLADCVQELALNVSRLGERIGAIEAGQTALERAIQEREAADPLKRGLDRVALMSSDLRKAVRRMTEATDKLVGAADTLRQLSASMHSHVASTDSEMLRPVFEELTALLDEAAPPDPVPGIAFQKLGVSDD